MTLKEIMKGIDYELIVGSIDENINKINYDSRLIEKDDLFFCIEGFNTDGHNYIEMALKKGASSILCRRVPDILPENCTILKVDDVRKALALASANYYKHPDKKMKIIGITGTNGKTTSTFMIKSILENAGYKVGLIGTIANYIGDDKLPSNRTTPESLELHKLFNNMVINNVEYCVMEVSSHSLYLDRVYGIEFCEGIFTNLTQDHLDFHKTFENYYNAKLKLFNSSKSTIVNVDDKYGIKVFNDVKCSKLTYSVEKDADLKAENIVMHSRGVEFDAVFKNSKEHININLPGMYNVSNALGSAAACLNEGLSLKQVKDGLEALNAVPGRCELVTKNYNLGFEVIIDYAHTPDGLENILKTAREFTRGRLISVFGCGGDRDKTKRPMMGKIGSSLSDIAIITSDNPRTEEPLSIINDIIKGVEKDNYIIVEDRKAAIKKAMEISLENDVIVVAGKGHEDYQVLKNGTIHFDEREVIADIVKELF